MVLNNNAEGTASGTTVTTSNSGDVAGNAFDALTIDATAGTSLTFDNSQFFLGKNAYKVLTSANTDNAYMNWKSTSLGVQTQHWGRFYYYITSNPSTEHNFLNFRRGAAAFAFRIVVTTASKLRVYNNANVSQGTSTNGFTLNAWNRVEWMADHTNQLLQLKIFTNPDVYKTVPTENFNFSGIDLGINFNEIYIGKSGAQNLAVTEWYDNININNLDWAGPAKFPTALNNYMGVKAGDGMWVGEKIR